MKYAKGTVITVLGKETYMVVGKWSGGYVLHHRMKGLLRF